MSKRKVSTGKSERALAEQRAAGTHNPASQCSCGTWRTPGQQHAKGDVGALPAGVTAPQCSN